MIAEYEVENFLIDLKEKIKVYDLIFVEREKNQKTMAELEIFQSDCKKYILHLKVENYLKGPVKDSQYGNEYWEFGIEIKGKEIYIKLNYGQLNKPVICISFHFAEHRIKYKFKK
ncbi:MAG TPA: toxin [Ignavibacteria bacterium]|nr:toxin [Ignavibacteria bacterium]HMR41891.1 toxin [Ignavibacteria bacterium]